MKALEPKDPDAVLDYMFDWTDWLQTGETIDSHTITVPTGLTLDSDSELSGKVTAWLSGGTSGISYTVACKIVTSLNRTDERSFQLPVIQR